MSGPWWPGPATGTERTRPCGFCSTVLARGAGPRWPCSRRPIRPVVEPVDLTAVEVGSIDPVLSRGDCMAVDARRCAYRPDHRGVRRSAVGRCVAASSSCSTRQSPGVAWMASRVQLRPWRCTSAASATFPVPTTCAGFTLEPRSAQSEFTFKTSRARSQRGQTPRRRLGHEPVSTLSRSLF